MPTRVDLIEIYQNRATGRYGLSDVDQLQHALQCAARAQAAAEADAFIVAALLHDVGHMIHELGEQAATAGIDDTHELRAAHWLTSHFGPEVVEPIRLHVRAKRYLCATDPGYFGKLSEDSVLSLRLQGGPMSPHEVGEFRCEPYFEAAVRLRRIDDMAKDPDARTPPFSHFLPLINKVLLDRTAL